jgi:hypothetical protein
VGDKMCPFVSAVGGGGGCASARQHSWWDARACSSPERPDPPPPLDSSCKGRHGPHQVQPGVAREEGQDGAGGPGRRVSRVPALCALLYVRASRSVEKPVPTDSKAASQPTSHRLQPPPTTTNRLQPTRTASNQPPTDSRNPQAAADATMARVTGALDYAPFKSVDMVIEAVIEVGSLRCDGKFLQWEVCGGKIAAVVTFG